MAEAEQAEVPGFTLELILCTGDKVLRKGPALQREGIEEAVERINRTLTSSEAAAGELVHLGEFGWTWVCASHVAALRVRRLKK